MSKAKIIFDKPWAYAKDGVNVVHYSTGEHEVDETTAAQAIREGVAHWPEPGPAKAKRGSPRTKAKYGPGGSGSTK